MSRWDEFYGLWSELNVEQVLIDHWPVPYRWQIERLLERLEAVEKSGERIWYEALDDDE
jgi:hypothetical protein